MKPQPFFEVPHNVGASACSRFGAPPGIGCGCSLLSRMRDSAQPKFPFMVTDLVKPSRVVALPECGEIQFSGFLIPMVVFEAGLEGAKIIGVP